ncbi:MAG: hypothetical protein KGJ35_00645 [Patescibacteria group bacterium]|nr:hypothetical protein [Patescibacteria group bacterium]
MKSGRSLDFIKKKSADWCIGAVFLRVVFGIQLLMCRYRRGSWSSGQVGLAVMACARETLWGSVGALVRKLARNLANQADEPGW